jgi:hypothetical protein
MRRLLYIGTLLLAVGVLATSCNKEFELIAASDNVAPGQSLLKINFASAYAANPGVQFKLNDVRISPVITARYPFPGGGFNTGGGSQADYLTVSPGNNALSISIPKKNSDTDSVQVFKTNITLDPDKAYSVHIADTAANTKVLVTVEDRSQPDTGKTRFRFVNLMPNVAALDLYYGTTLVAANVPYMGMSNYITMPVPTTALAWTIREAGSAATSTALATYTSASTTQSQRVYTAFAMGYKGETTAARKPYISFYRVM